MRDLRATCALLVFFAILCITAGCDTLSIGQPDERFIKPTVAVMKFENRAGSPMGWNLGDGMADILVDRLIATRRYHVIERPELDAVLGELRLQNSGVTREQNRLAQGRIKNVQYLIKGTVTDFGHVSSSNGFLSGSNFALFGGGNRAVMGMTLYVVDVESGEIICSQSIQESVRAKDLAATGAYKGVTFGGTTFYQTPLGKATQAVIDKAVRQISSTIANRPWEPKIASIETGSVIINGGQDRDIQVGAEFDVLQLGQPILDPDSGDVIGHRSATLLGRVRVTAVSRGFSVAQIVRGRGGDFQIGQPCRATRPAE